MRLFPKIILTSAIFASFFIFYPSFNYYFFQDDWFVLNWVTNNPITSFFAFRTDIIYWRPISMPILFFVVNKVFSLNPLAYHLIAYSFFILLMFSIYKLFNMLLKDQKMASVGAFLYGVWSIHFISLSWFSTTSYILGPFFIVWSLIKFLEFSSTGKKLAYILSFLFFIFAIASTEFAILIPVIIFVHSVIYKKKIIFKLLLPFSLIIVTYMILRFVIFPIPSEGDYSLSFNTTLIKNFGWYILWALGFPERFNTLIYPALPKESLNAFLEFWKVSLPASLLSILIFSRVVIFFKKNLKVNIFAIVWFIVSLTPVILLSNHSYPVYLSLAGIGFILLIVSTFRSANYFLIVGLMLLWLITSYANIDFTRKTHWIPNEQAVSEAYTQYAKSKRPTISDDTVLILRRPDNYFAIDHNFVLVESEDTLKLSLSDQNAMKVVYGHKNLQSIYSDKLIDPNEFKQPIFEIFPKR